MRGLQTFLEESQASMVDYILVVSTPDPPPLSAHTSRDSTDRLNAEVAVNIRKQSMPGLQQESIPQLPFLTDSPRDLAMLAAGIARQVQSKGMSALPENQGKLDDLVKACMRLEQQALKRVKRLAQQTISEHQHLARLASSSTTTVTAMNSNSHYSHTTQPQPHQPQPTPHPSLRLLTVLDKASAVKRSPISPRPMTAPSPSPSRPTHHPPSTSSSTSNSHSQSRGFSNSQADDQALTPTEESSRTNTNDGSGSGGSWPLRKRLAPSHPRSISTDSITMFKPPTSSPLSPPLASGAAGDDANKRTRGFGFLRQMMPRK